MIKITNLKGLFAPQKKINIALHSATEKIAKLAEETARTDYKSKRKTQKMPSLIINSFAYEVKNQGNMIFTAKVYNTAPYAVYVDRPRSYRGGSGSFPGYHFMRAGAIKARQDAKVIINRELKYSAGINAGAILSTRNM